MNTMLLVLTGVSLAIAAVTSTIAWRVTQADRRRRAARIAALAAAAGVPDASAASESLAHAAARPEALVTEPGGIAMADRFLSADASGSGSDARQHRLLAAAGAAAGIVLVVAAISLVGGRGPAAAHADTAAPLELLSLGHQRVDGQLTVSGMVRNPAAGTAVDQLEAEVRVFDPAGILVATRTALIGAQALSPGQESSFAVALGESTTAARYRVSFRAAGALRPHVDQRSNTPASVDRTAEAR
jgi:hypothetical protein